MEKLLYLVNDAVMYFSENEVTNVQIETKNFTYKIEFFFQSILESR